VAGPKHFGFDLLYCGTCMATTSNPIVWKSTVGDILGFYPETLKKLPPLIEEEQQEVHKEISLIK